MRSVRFRLAITYSVLVFALALVVLGAVNLGLSRALSGQPVVQEVVFPSLSRTLGGFELQLTRARMVDLERLVNERALDNLRRYSLYTVAFLFPLSVVIGWLVAGRALRPVERIGGVAREIQSTDLSRRIRLGGTDDEFKRLADTFDAMLDRLEKGQPGPAGVRRGHHPRAAQPAGGDGDHSRRRPIRPRRRRRVAPSRRRGCPPHHRPHLADGGRVGDVRPPGPTRLSLAPVPAGPAAGGVGRGLSGGSGGERCRPPDGERGRDHGRG